MFFLNLQGSLISTYYEDQNHIIFFSQDFENISLNKIYRRYYSDISIGFGFGRIRNITPVIQALRFNERLNTLNKDLFLSGEEVQIIAQEVAKRRGYWAVFDRHEKYFWRDLFNKIPNIRDQVTPFEFNYLAEVFRENIGVRLQGWDLTLNFNVYKPWYTRDPSNWITNVSTGGLSLLYRIYKNILLSHQIGFEGKIFNSFSLNPDNAIATKTPRLKE